MGTRVALGRDTVPFFQNACQIGRSTLVSDRIIFSSVRGGGSPNLYAQAADGTGTATRLTDSPNPQYPTGITTDATQVILNEATPATLADIRLLTMTPTPQVKPLVETRFDERGGVVSPDGRWLAYESNRSGAYEVYVQPFPAVDRGLSLVSTGGGTQPLWARNGQELFYVAPDGAIMAERVPPRGGAWSHDSPTKVFAGSYATGAPVHGRNYDVSSDGKRFLMIKQTAEPAGQAAPADRCRPELARRAEAPRAEGLTVTCSALCPGRIAISPE